MGEDFRILVLISGRGSNFKSLIDNLENYSILGVLSDKTDAPGLQYGQDAGIPCYPFNRKDYPSRKALKQAIFEQCRQLKPDLIALAGFMQVIQPAFVEAFDSKMVNIHPSLLPKYPGLDTHQQVLKAGDAIHGCTIHFVDTGVDTGPIIAQASCDCFPDDTEETISKRVLQFEHQLYPWVISGIARGGIALKDRKIQFSQQIVEEAKQRNFILGNKA